MATINLADKYSSRIVERFYTDSVILGKTSKDYDWDGVQSIKVWSINTYEPVNYTRPTADTAGASLARYGQTREVADDVQIMTLTQDKAVSLSVDKGNNTEQMLVKNAGTVMARELREQFVPMFDKYCLAQWSDTTNTVWGSLIQTTIDATLTKANIVEAISSHVTALMNAQTDINDAYCYIGATNFGKLVLSPEFLNLEKLGDKALDRGVLGKVRGLQIVPIPDSYLPTGINFMTVKKSCVLAPTKIKDAKVHSDPVGISGALLEVRWLYDSFVLKTKAKGIVVSKVSAS